MSGPLHTGSESRVHLARRLGLAALLGLALATVPAAARANPSFTFEKRQDVKGVTWSGKLRAGAFQTGGNTDSLGFSTEGTISRTTPGQRLILGGSAAYARSRVVVPAESDGLPGLGPGELGTVDSTTRKNWNGYLRWDRFLSTRGSAYLLAGAASDEPAGKQLVLGGQIGYGLDLLRSEHQGLRLELGYDYSREKPFPPAPQLDIHSARLFAGYEGQVLEPVTLDVSIEALTNLNAEHGGPRPLRPFQDTRLLGKLGLRVKINGSLSTGLQLTGAYDAAPAFRPPPPGFSWAAGYAPLAQRFDTTSELFIMARF